MSATRPTLIILHGGAGSGPAEKMLAAVRVAAARESAKSALAAGYAAVIVATDVPGQFGGLADAVIVDADDAAGFRLDRRLHELIARFAIASPVVMGSGAAPLLGREGLEALREQLCQPGSRLVTNNFYSGDVTGWTPGQAIARLSPFERDNQLPRRLRDEAGLTAVTLPRTTATQFDLDTPADLAVLALQDALPAGIAEALPRAELPLERYRRVGALLCDPQAEIVVAGRVGSQAWQYLERETACRVRMFSEERGMAAAGDRHQPRALLGYMVEDVGYESFFRRIAAMGDALVLDTRVIEAHLGLRPSREDRFQSDLFRVEAIQDPGLCELTAAARDAPIPVLLGGHSLVSGGLMALNDAAWAEHDRGASPPS